jgi:putative transposase
MPEHIHLVILPHSSSPQVGPILNSIKQSVAKRAVRWTRDNAPHKLNILADEIPGGNVIYRFWQRGAGQDRNLWNLRATWNAIDYIHKNPVERGLTSRPEDFRWTSFHEHRRLGSGPIAIDPEKFLQRPP